MENTLEKYSLASGMTFQEIAKLAGGVHAPQFFIIAGA